MVAEWIKCVDRLPKIEGNYIVCCWDSQVEAPFVMEGYYSDATGDYQGGWGNFEGSPIEPTHWMEMPDPPIL